MSQKTDQKPQQEIQKLQEDMLMKFLQFQVDNDVRAVVVNKIDDPLVNFIMTQAILGWKKIEESEKLAIQSELAKRKETT